MGRNPRMMNRKFRKCVEHHRNIREFMRLFEQTYSGIFLAQFVASMLMFALVGFQAIIMPLEPIISIYCLCILVQLFLVCHLANNILEKVNYYNSVILIFHIIYFILLRVNQLQRPPILASGSSTVTERFV